MSTTQTQNKRRGANDERDVARRLGGNRHQANTGGPEDVRHSALAIQVKGGNRVVNETFRKGIRASVDAASGTDKLPCLVLIDRGAKGRPERYVAFRLEDWIEWQRR